MFNLNFFDDNRSAQRATYTLTLLVLGIYVLFTASPINFVAADEEKSYEVSPSSVAETEQPSPSPEESVITTPEVTPEPTPKYTPTPSPTPMPMGSITICKIIIDNENNLVDGSTAAGTMFEIVSISPNSSLDAPVGLFGNASFTAPLSYNADLLPGLPGNDSQCTTFSSLMLGAYYYDQETISDSSNWLAPLYNDQFTIPVMSLSDFFPYDGNLFDGDPSNDLNRNQNVDGHIILTPERSDRTLILLNQLNSEGGVGGCPDCESPTPSPTPDGNNGGGGSNTPTPIPTASPTPDSNGGGSGGSNTPTPTPSASPIPSSGGGGGGGIGLPITPTATPGINGSSVTPTPTPGVGGAMDELPATSYEYTDIMMMIGFALITLTGIFMILRGVGYIVYENK